MSTIKVNKIENTATADGGIAIDASGHVTVDGQQLPTDGALSSRNVIINGNFVFAQRATSQTNTGVNSIDRWRAQESGATTTMSQESFTLGQTDVPGASKFLKFDVTTGNNNAGVQQRVEAQNVYHFLGNKVTLSYFAKGTSPASGLEVAITWLDGSSTSSSASTSVTLTSTWTKYTHTFTVPSDSGLTLTNAAASLEVKWMQFNSDTGTAAWELNLAQVQLELGDKATPFEHRSYGDELARCQRYYYRHAEFSSGGSVGMAAFYQASRIFVGIHFPTTMRAQPTLDASDFTNAYRVFRNGGNEDFNGFAQIQESGTSSVVIESDATLSATGGQAGWCRLQSSPAHISFSAEL